MNSKTRLLLTSIIGFLIVIQSVSSQSSSHHPQINDRINQFIGHLNKKEWSEAFDLTYPKLFETVGKHEMVGMMEQMDQDGIHFTTDDVKILSYSEIVSTDEEDFVLVEYDSKQVLSMPPDATAEDEVKNLTLQSLKQSMASQEVVYDETNDKFVISGTKSMFAISGKGLNNWFILENNPNQQELLKLLIPVEVRSKLINTK